jgi:hypothetical protein
MSTIEKMRGVADLLVSQKKFDEAYTIYDELFHQIWGVFGAVQCSYSGYPVNPIGTRFPFDPTLRKQFPEPAANTLCLRLYNTNLSLILDEFIKVMYGHLQCIISSPHIHKEISFDTVLTEFAVLYTLVLQPIRSRRLSPVFSMSTALVDRNNRLKRIISNYPRSVIEKLLVEHATTCKDIRWKTINHILSDYLLRTGYRKSEFFRKVSKTVDPGYYRFQYDHHYTGRNEKNNRYNDYEKYKQQSSSSSRKFHPNNATEQEKNAYYGKLIGLSGKVTKEQIRSKYIGMIFLYHPDRVQHLGPEIKELAETKSKELNAAYDWFKEKYHF